MTDDQISLRSIAAFVPPQLRSLQPEAKARSHAKQLQEVALAASQRDHADWSRFFDVTGILNEPLHDEDAAAFLSIREISERYTARVSVRVAA